MQTSSLSRRVLTIVLTAQMLCAAALSLSALLHERSTRIKAFDEILKGRADSLLGAIQDAEDPNDRVFVDPRELNLPATDAYAVYNEDGSAVGISPNAPPGLLDIGDKGYFDRKSSRTDYRVYQRSALRIVDRTEDHGKGIRRPITIVYASPERHLKSEIMEAARFYLLLVATLAIITALSVFLFVKKALRPLIDFTQATGKLSAPTLTFAAPQSVLQVEELRPLAEVLTSVVQSLRLAFEKERRFVGDAAHELKTAIAVIQSTVQLQMIKPRSSDEHATGLSRVLEDTRRLELLVGQMLSSSGADDLSLESLPATDLAECVAATLAGLRPVATARGIELSSNTGGPAPVRLRPERASVLLSNLVMNSIQHSGSGMAVIVELSSSPAGVVSLEVIDTGSGIQPDALPHVFERFFREDASRSRDTGGAGLGLSICKSIVEAAGGSIAIASEPHVRTTVSVTFPGAATPGILRPSPSNPG